MKKSFTRGSHGLPLALLALGATLSLSGCWEKDKDGSCAPKGATCNTAAVVVDLSKTTGCGLALHLADSTYVIPTGSTWTNFLPKAGQKVTVGIVPAHAGKGGKCAGSTTSAACPAGKLVELGCITLVSPTTTGAN